MKRIYIIISCFLFMFSCKKEQDNVPSPVLSTTVTMQFESVVDGVPIKLDGTEYDNSLGQKYSISEWKYFISNIEFYNEGALIFKEKDSYHYINQDKVITHEFVIEGVPVGTYDEIRYSFGVDDEHNNRTSFNGDLHDSPGMFWNDWNGFKFSLFEGKSVNEVLAVHIGGNLNYKVFKFDLNSDMITVGTKNTSVYSIVNINGMFNSPNQIDFSSGIDGRNEEETLIFGNNIENGTFTIDRIENPI